MAEIKQSCSYLPLINIPESITKDQSSFQPFPVKNFQINAILPIEKKNDHWSKHNAEGTQQVG